MTEIEELEEISLKCRRNIVKMVHKAGYGHVGSSLSCVDILSVLFFHTMDYNLSNPWRDRLVISKGHASEAYYTVLQQKGLFDEEELWKYANDGALLTAHPTNHVPGIDFCTGALGHGLSIASGMALGAKKAKKAVKVFAICGDGELDEGSNWEVAISAVFHKLGNLVLIVDNNKLQLNDSVSNTMEIQPIGEKFAAFGWDVINVNGHNIKELIEAFDNIDYEGQVPHVIVADTVKGKGVSFMENVVCWHHKIPDDSELQRALEELK